MRGLVVLTTRVPDRVEGPPGEVELLMAHHPEVLVAHPHARPTHAVARSPPSISSYPTRPAVAARDDCRAVRTQSQREKQMRIYLTSVLVDDQEKALRFYTDVLGFVKKTDIPLGEARWLTVVDPGHLLRRRRRARRVPAAPRPRRAVHAGAGRHGRRDDGGVRRHLRQPDPDRQGIASPATIGRNNDRAPELALGP